MQLLDGKALSQKIEERITQEVHSLALKGITPGLAVILVGSDPASQAYVHMKAKACKRAGIYSILHEMPENTTQSQLLNAIAILNHDPSIDGILVQLPLPKHINTATILEAIAPHKDVDGFHPHNIGRIAANLEGFAPATPMGILRLLEHHGIEVCGKNATIVGASNIVGKPLASLLLNANATTTICHIYTRDLASHTREADILCVGVGKPNLITEAMVKEGAVVIDIGINRLNNGLLVGDVDFERVAPKCSFITPVPGGVGPMTIASLLENTLRAAKNRQESL